MNDKIIPRPESFDRGYARWAVFLALLPALLAPLLAGLAGVMAVRFFGVARQDVRPFLESSLPFIIVVGLLLVLALLVRVLHRHGDTFGELGWFREGRGTGTEIVLGLVSGPCIYLFYELALEPLHDLIRGNQLEFSVGLRLAESVPWAFVAVSVALVFVEESVYRGFWWRAMRPRLGAVGTVLLGSLVFGVAHWIGGLWTLFSAAVLGLVFFIIFLARGRTLVAGTVAHATYNLLAQIFA